MEKINSNVKTIEVNDAGETITVNLGDTAQISGLLSLIQDFGETAKQLAGQTSDLDGTTQEQLAKIRDAATRHLEACSGLKDRVDAVLGPDTCRKVFGDGIPSIPDFAEFFSQLGALIQQFSAEMNSEREARISKYTAKYAKNRE